MKIAFVRRIRENKVIFSMNQIKKYEENKDFCCRPSWNPIWLTSKGPIDVKNGFYDP